jgi:hypothetical protein
MAISHGTICTGEFFTLDGNKFYRCYRDGKCLSGEISEGAECPNCRRQIVSAEDHGDVQVRQVVKTIVVCPNGRTFELGTKTQAAKTCHETSRIQLTFLKPTHLEDGEYPGKQSGYSVVFEIPSGPIQATSPMGVRGINVPVTVIVSGGIASLKP